MSRVTMDARVSEMDAQLMTLIGCVLFCFADCTLVMSNAGAQGEKEEVLAKAGSGFYWVPVDAAAGRSSGAAMPPVSTLAGATTTTPTTTAGDSSHRPADAVMVHIFQHA